MPDWAIVAIIGVVLLFGARKLPDMARGLGQSMRIFKAETRGMKEDEQAGGSAPGEIAPGRAAGSGDDAPSATPQGTTSSPGAGSPGASAPSASSPGTADGAPRAGS